MTDERNILSQIEQEERRLAPWLAATPLPTEHTLAQVRQSVAVELESDVLDAFAHPVPDRTALDHVTEAVRAEIERTTRRTRGGRTWRVFVGVAVAASLVVAVAWVRRVVPPAQTPTLADRETTSEFLETMTLAFQSAARNTDLALSVLAEDIDRLMDSHPVEPYDSTDVELRDIGDQIDNLFVQESSSFET